MDTHALNDGRRIEIRPIRADDGDRLQASHARLSPESSYRRFLGAKPHLTAADARYLVDVDGCDHFALVATIDEDGDQSIIAVTRFVRLESDPRTAEFAIVVGDAYQRQGLAGELLARLARAATDRGVTRFRATVLSDNPAVVKLLEKVSAGPLRDRPSGPTSDVDIDLVPSGDDVRRPAPAMIAAWAGS